MKSLFRIFNQTIVKEYYRQNAVFVFAVLMFAFGFLRATEHITIIKNTLRHPSLLALAFAVWALHALKVTLFTLRLLESRQNEFLYHARLYPAIQRFFAFCGLQLSLIQLTFLYALAMVKFGIEEQNWQAVVYIVLFNVFLVVAGAVIYEYRIQRPNAAQVRNRAVRSFFAGYTTPPYLFFIRYLFSKQPVLLLLTKLFACLVLMGVCNLYPTDDYDERLMALGGLFAAAGHTVICQQYLEFENRFMSITRNLPLSNWQRLFQFGLSYFILLIPELVIVLRNLPHEVNYGFSLILIIFIWSIVCLNHHVQYINGISYDTFMQRVFFVGVLYLLLIMFRVPLFLIALVNTATAVLVFRKHYFRSEFNP
ncbi:hypothetical protein [Emticicia sp. 21SJ11W-3]|uniref:hypothetical protein n=1 Tax=Emticicia sp. 21SJ11W-3 TaxID=2916755 RepID=UPI0020A1FABF|nr:hypothetical protein [Emticicia sp. 21SJ11W-3]UTA69774.1 hypothetical protein MB380_08170 [Emticicia sp. 21SJ11W-3]